MDIKELKYEDYKRHHFKDYTLEFVNVFSSLTYFNFRDERLNEFIFRINVLEGKFSQEFFERGVKFDTLELRSSICSKDPSSMFDIKPDDFLKEFIVFDFLIIIRTLLYRGLEDEVKLKAIKDVMSFSKDNLIYLIKNDLKIKDPETGQTVYSEPWKQCAIELSKKLMVFFKDFNQKYPEPIPDDPQSF